MDTKITIKEKQLLKEIREYSFNNKELLNAHQAMQV